MRAERTATAAAVRDVILTNELAHTRNGLRLLIGWLGMIADDFGAHGCDVTDLRWEIQRLTRELRRRGGLVMSFAILLLEACMPRTERRAEQYRSCETAYRLMAQRVTECLIMKYDWEPGYAGLVGATYDLYLSGRARNPLYLIRGPEHPAAAELKSILQDLAMGQAARVDQGFGYTARITDIPWVADLDPAYDVRIERATYRGWAASIVSQRDSLRCAVFYGGPPLAPATQDSYPACAKL